MLTQIMVFVKVYFYDTFESSVQLIVLYISFFW